MNSTPKSTPPLPYAATLTPATAERPLLNLLPPVDGLSLRQRIKLSVAELRAEWHYWAAGVTGAAIFAVGMKPAGYLLLQVAGAQ